MTSSLDQHLAGIADQRVPCWLDAWSYGIRLLRRNQPAPWGDIGELVAFHRQLQGLVKSDVVTVDVADFYRYWLDAHPGLVAAMGEKRRLGYALRTLLADGGARARLPDIVAALCDSYPRLPLVLALPSPRRWAGLAHCRASGADSVEVSWDNAESAAMYMADFLRLFSQLDLGGLLLADDPGSGPANDLELARYQPVLNVADHYRWQVTLLGCAPGFLPTGDNASIRVIAEHSSGGDTAARLPESFWSAGLEHGTPTPRFWYGEIPAESVPETVLERLAALAGKSA